MPIGKVAAGAAAAHAASGHNILSALWHGIKTEGGCILHLALGLLVLGLVVGAGCSGLLFVLLQHFFHIFGS